MAGVIESQNTNGWAVAASTVITKPTGLAEGDMLFAIIGTSDSGAARTPGLPAGWTSVFSIASDTGARPGVLACYKIADAGDVAASDFTFSGGGGDSACGTLYRLSGVGELAIYDNDTDGDGGTGVWTITKSLTPLVSGALLFNVFYGDTGSYSTYTLVGGDTVTFTERLDAASAESVNIAISDTTTYDSTDEITSVGATIAGTPSPIVSLLVAVYPINNASGTAALVSNTLTMQAPTASSGTTGTAARVDVTMEAQAPTATSKNKVWTNTSRGNTTWTNTSK